MVRIIGMLSNYGEVLVDTILHHRDITPVLFIATHLTVAAVLTGHKRSARRSAHRASGIGLGKLHAFAGHGVDTGCGYILLAIAAQVAIPHIITHYIYDVRAVRRSA